MFKNLALYRLTEPFSLSASELEEKLDRRLFQGRIKNER